MTYSSLFGKCWLEILFRYLSAIAILLRYVRFFSLIFTGEALEKKAFSEDVVNFVLFLYMLRTISKTGQY